MIYGKRHGDVGLARVDGDIVAFAVPEQDIEDVVDMLTSAIFTACMIEFGTIPIEIE